MASTPVPIFQHTNSLKLFGSRCPIGRYLLDLLYNENLGRLGKLENNLYSVKQSRFLWNGLAELLVRKSSMQVIISLSFSLSAAFSLSRSRVSSFFISLSLVFFYLSSLQHSCEIESFMRLLSFCLNNYFESI